MYTKSKFLRSTWPIFLHGTTIWTIPIVLGNGSLREVFSNSYLLDNIVYSVLIDKKTLRITGNDLASHTLLVKYEFDEKSGSEQLTQPPVKEDRYGRKLHSKEASIKNIIKDFSSGSGLLGVIVARTESGQLVLTAGTYMPIFMGGGGGSFTGGYVQDRPTSFPNSGAQLRWDPYKYGIPGNPGSSTPDARYYFTTHFSLLLDPTSLKAGKGKLPVPVGDQIKDYLDDAEKKSKATNQFAIGKNQYFGYYDKDSQAYVIEQIPIL